MTEPHLLATAIYIRVSTEEQAKEGFSINAQKEKLKQFALAKDWNIYDFYIDDGISGKNLKDRPEVNRMLKDIIAGKIDNVLIYKIDRLTRSTKNLIELIELFNAKNCAFNSLMESIDTTSATGRMFIKIVGIFAEFERENLAERVSFGYEQKTREGNYTNTHGVYGYDYIFGEGKLIINEKEKEIVNYIYQAYLNGKSMTKIAKNLINDAVATKRGGNWCQSTIYSILTNPLYIGKVRYGVNSKHEYKFDAESDHEPIIDIDTFAHVQEIMKKRKKYTARKYPSENTYFLGALFCNKCGARLGTTQHTRGKNGTGKLYVNYYCYNSKNGNCDCRVMSQNKLEHAFLNYIGQLKDFTPDESIIESDTANNDEKAMEQVRKELDRTNKKLSDIRDLFLKDKLSFDEYRTFSLTLEAKISELEQSLESVKVKESENELDYEAIKSIVGNIRENWKYLTNEEKGQFIHRFISKIKIFSDSRDITISDVDFYKLSLKTKDLCQ